MTKYIKKFHSEEIAATTVEYAIMLALIIGVCFAAIQLMGGETGNVMDSNSNQISDAMNQ